MELFACNPYRVLGVAVNASNSEITEKYNKLLSLAESGKAESYSSPFDFDSLPPFSRTADAIKTAYAKLASNGYRCFAYSDSDFTVALNIDDVALNLRDLRCYDCFLRCYMWLVINDREMEEHELWIQLATYIDKLITSSPDDWYKLFDNRFPAENSSNDKTLYKSFYTTFCEIILLPLKEMVRGSMRCKSATEILTAKGIDVNEKFEFIDIPQANLPKKGEPEPLLKIAVKDGEEYFDIATGKMVSFSSDSSADVESNVFEETAAPITAEAILSEDDEAEAEVEQEAVEEYVEEYEEEQPQTFEEESYSEPEPVAEEAVEIKPEVKPEPKKPEVQQKPKENPFAKASTAPKREKKLAPPKAESEVQNVKAPQLRKKASASQPTVLNSDAQPAIQTAPKLKKKPTAVATEESKPEIQTAPKLKRKNSPATEEKPATPSKEVSLTDDAEDEENLYTAALIQMLKVNKGKKETMKEADTKHMVGEQLKASAPPELEMDEINMKKFNKKLLASPYGTENRGAEMSREEKYRNIKIDDMLNPTLGGKTQRNTFQPDAIEEFKKNKQEKKSATKSLMKSSFLIAVLVIIFIALKLFDII